MLVTKKDVFKGLFWFFFYTLRETDIYLDLKCKQNWGGDIIPNNCLLQHCNEETAIISKKKKKKKSKPSPPVCSKHDNDCGKKM